MSLVQAFIGKDFIVVGSDSKATFSDHISNTYKKIYKLNTTTIIGMTGDISSNVRLFNNYINADFSINEKCNSMSFNEIKEGLFNTFNEMNTTVKDFSLHSVICGWDGNKMVAYTMFAGDSNKLVNGINEIYATNNDVRIISCGNLRHNETAIRLGKNINNINILKIKNLFKQVINEGMKFDDTINSNVQFEKIRKGDII